MAKTGRPCSLTDEIQGLICTCIREGNYREVAAGWAGVSKRTLSEWVRRGKGKPESRYGLFLRAVLEAERDAEREAVERVWRAAAQDPKHAQWWLERKFPERWGSQRAEVRALQRRIAELEKQLGSVPSARPATVPAGGDEDTVL